MVSDYGTPCHEYEHANPPLPPPSSRLPRTRCGPCLQDPEPPADGYSMYDSVLTGQDASLSARFRRHIAADAECVDTGDAGEGRPAAAGKGVEGSATRLLPDMR